jgi:NADH dehydrogenase [ubiquinone] 1 alpha subcomplex assembly factor 6
MAAAVPERRRCFATTSTTGGVRTTTRTNDEAYCVELVQRRDREAYYCGLLMPARYRDAYFALRAFNVEIASIKDQNRSSSSSASSSPGSALALQLRMQWWRDAVASLYESQQRRPSLSLANPVVRALGKSHGQFPLTRRFLDRIIDAREADLEVRQYQTVAALSHYAEETACSLLYLTLELCHDDQNKVTLDHLARADEMAYHVGLGIGLTTALRGTPHRLVVSSHHNNNDQAEMPIPVELLGESFRMTDAITQNETFRTACRDLAATATDHFCRARELQGRVHSTHRPIFLTMLPSIHYLSRLAQADHDVFAATATTGSDQLRLLLVLARSWLTGVY